MADFLTPKLHINQSFEDAESFGKAIGWDLDFRQIEPGPLRARATVFGHADIMVLRAEFDRSFHQIGALPPGLVSFGFSDKKSGILRWKGIETPPGVLINFNYMKELDCVNTGPFGAYVLSLSNSVLKSASEELGLGPDLVDKAVSSWFWNPEQDENAHDQLRQVLRALEKVAVHDGDKGLELWKDVFNSDIPDHLVRIITMESSASRLAGPVFGAKAMNRAVEILRDYTQFPINIEALCTMVGASWATLQRAFIEEFGVSPSSYIKSRRLSAVQSELIKKGPTAVISDVANRWGFWHMGSFAADYRKQFGELLSETLRRIKLV